MSVTKTAVPGDNGFISCTLCRLSKFRFWFILLAPSFSLKGFSWDFRCKLFWNSWYGKLDVSSHQRLSWRITAYQGGWICMRVMLLLDPFLSVLYLLPFSQLAPLLRLIERIADCLWYAQIPNLLRIMRIRRCGIVGRYLYVVYLVSRVVRISFLTPQ